MGLTGIVFAVAAVAWLTYGVPHFLSSSRTPDEEEQIAETTLTEAVRILRPARPGSALTRVGSEPPSVSLVDVDGHEFTTAELSTPFTRRTELRRLRRIENAAIRIRRAVLALTMAGEALLLIAAISGWLPWWSLAFGALGLVAVIAGLRTSVVLVDRELDRRVDQLREGSKERTIAISRAEVLELAKQEARSEEPRRPVDTTPGRSVISAGGSKVTNPLVADIPGPDVAPSLWEPLPVPEPTYVQRPITARSVRTIDLSSPSLHADMDRAQGDMPVTADTPDEQRAQRTSRRPKLRAVGE